MCQEGTWEQGSGAAAAQSLDSESEIAQNSCDGRACGAVSAGTEHF